MIFLTDPKAVEAYAEFLKRNAAPPPPKQKYLIKYYQLGTGAWRPLTDVEATSEEDALIVARRVIGDALKDDEVLCAEAVS